MILESLTGAVIQAAVETPEGAHFFLEDGRVLIILEPELIFIGHLDHSNLH